MGQHEELSPEGTAAARRRLPVAIDDNERSLSAEEKTATVRDLFEARSGIYHAALYETPSMAARRPPRASHAPGTFWYYNNWHLNALGTIYEHATRHSIFDALASEIARPIGMQDYQPSDGKYVTGAASVYPAYPIDMSARDLARSGIRGRRTIGHVTGLSSWPRTGGLLVERIARRGMPAVKKRLPAPTAREGSGMSSRVLLVIQRR